MSFPAYPTYDDSGILWLGSKPSHWQLTRLRFVSRLNPSKSEISDGDPSTEVIFLPMDSIGENGSLALDQTRAIASVSTGYSYFREGDVTIAKITPCFENGKGAIMRGLEGGFGFGTTELIVVRPIAGKTSADFLNWIFRSSSFRALGEAAMYGAGGQKRVPDDFVRDFSVALPPLDEQAYIAAFLDRETAKIDALVEEQRRLIALLKEKRQAVISHAVTKGLNPDAPMKDSGVEWLGEVPAHWSTRSISSVSTKITNGYVGPTRDILVDQGVRYLQSLHIKHNRIIFDREYFVTDEWSRSHAKSILKSGDVLLVQTGDIGQCAVVTDDFVGCNCHALIIVSPVDDVLIGSWLSWVLNSSYGQQSLYAVQTGALHPHLNCGNIKGISIPLPALTEQREIIRFIEVHLSQYQELIDEALRAITLLVERRAALVSAAVTGKIDVRGIAKMLPFSVNRARARGLIAAEIIERSARQATFGRVKLQKLAYLAEAHAGITELEGVYLREAAGPLDREMIQEMEREAGALAGVRVEQPDGAGSAVAYRLGDRSGVHRQDLAALLGDRAAKFDKLIEDIGTIDTKGAEAVATLYAVWNDALIGGETPTDMEIKLAVLSEWHPEKARKFRIDELQTWLDWMRRHGLVPTGAGPKTSTGRLFA